jgi:hypothetical protein
MRKKSRSSSTAAEISSTDEIEVSPTSVGSPVLSVTSTSMEIEIKNRLEGRAIECMNNIVGDGDFDVPMNDGCHSAPADFEVPVKADYGYEDAPPSSRRHYYDYGDAAPDDKSKYGYGDAAADDKSKYGHGDAAPDNKPEYGYGDAAPDDKSNYGYGDAAPDDKSNGYGVSVPDDKSKYGYEDAGPSRRYRRPHRRRTCGADDDDDYLSRDSTGSSLGSTRSTMRSSLRSSIKKGGSSRRASIQFGGEISVYLPGQEEPVKRRTSISFNESVKVKKVDLVKNLTDAPETLWFQDEEFQAIRRRSLDLVDKYDNGQMKGKKYCIRGLEKLTKSRRKKVMERKYDAWDAVLDEQDVQRDSGTWDEEYMANAYKYKTAEPQEDALRQGMEDYGEIEKYMRSTRNICRRLSM